MSWRPWLEDRALRQMPGLPPEAFDMLVRTLARICDDPYDPVFSAPVPPVPGRRVAVTGALTKLALHERQRSHLQVPSSAATCIVCPIWRSPQQCF